jgi:methyl-accepting chemotaxis protein
MSDRELRERLDFIGLDERGRAALQGARETLAAAIPQALDELYDQIRRTPDARARFRDEVAMAGAKRDQTAHWGMIASAGLDARYVQEAQRLGLAHAGSEAAPRWYVAGHAFVLDRLIRAALKSSLKSKGLFGGKADPDAAAEVVCAIVKAALLDLDYGVSAQLEAVEAERRKAEAEHEALAADRLQAVEALSQALSRVSHGDLNARLDLRARLGHELPESLVAIQQDFNTMAERLEDAMGAISHTADQITAGADQISSSADDLSRRTEQQAAALEQTAAALDQITATVQKTAQGARQASEAVVGARSDAQKSGEVVRDAISAMSQIEGSAKQISQIIGVIDEIAFQTNLLALNAGVEAARAGESGRGFAVVAQEVRALAQRSADAAKEIKALISASSAQVDSGVALVGQTGQALERIIGRVAEIDSLVQDMATSAQEQSTGLHQVNSAVNQMDQAIQQNAAMVEQSTAATHALAENAEELGRLVAGFRAEDARRPVQRPAAQRARAVPAQAQILAQTLAQTTAKTPAPPPASVAARLRPAAPAPRPVVTAKPLARPAVRRIGNTAIAALPEADEDGWTEF